MNGNSGVPQCSICTDVLGRYGGPVTLPCGHNGCLHCFAQLQRAKPECPLCRAAFPASNPLVVNHELRDLVTLAAALGTVEQNDGWQAVTAQVQGGGLEAGGGGGGGKDGGGGVSLVPSAPPAHFSLERVLEGQGDLLSLEPPAWLPDSHASACSRCRSPFRALVRGRHHCRLCGGIFCAACSASRQLLPPRFRAPTPERVCTSCAALLLPLQPFLAGTISMAVQPAVHDVTDASALRSWFNNPLSACLGAELYKATNIVRAFSKIGALAPEKSIPAAVLDGAAGFAILSVAKGGCGWSVGAGTGLVVARRAAPRCWSPPCALALYSLGWGLQAGGALCDLLIVLRNQAAVAAFCGALHCGVSGSVSAAVGPLGRQAEVSMQIGAGGQALCYSYSVSRGAFVGASVDGSLIMTRFDVNLNFYGRPLTAKQLLIGEAVSAPLAADALYTALDDLMARAGALTAERRKRLESAAMQAGPHSNRERSSSCMADSPGRQPALALPHQAAPGRSGAAAWAALDWQLRREDESSGARRHAVPARHAEEAPLHEDEVLGAFGGMFDD